MADAGMSSNENFMQTESEPSFPLQYCIDMTNKFSEEGILGRGGFGVVYKGLHNGEIVAVKKLLQEIPSSQKQFENEVNFLMELKHPNIVRIVGYCYETRHNRMHHEKKSVFVWDTMGLLCLEYLPNGSLKDYISDASSGLNWHTRWKIIEGISYGLQYLHENSSEPIIHLDLKPANILLDADMLPKIADFGLSRLFDQNKTIHTANATGTFGYMPPEAIQRGIITPKSDIFSLGVIIMEVITGHRDYPDTRKPSKSFLEHELKKWRHRAQEPGYTSLETDCQQIERCLRIGLICVNEERTKRPTMKKIIDMLQGLESMDWYIGNEEMAKLLYDKKGLRIEGYTGDLAFYDMDRVEVMEISDVPRIPLPYLKRLNSLRSIHFKRCNEMVFAELNVTFVLHSVADLHIEELQITGELFSNVLRCFPALSELSIKKCESLELVPKEDGGLGDLTRLLSFKASSCKKLFSRWPLGEVGGGAHAIKPFPDSLIELDISFETSMQSMGLLSNLTSLTSLSLRFCTKLTMDGFNPRITVNLRKLAIVWVDNTSYSAREAGDLVSEIARSKLLYAGSFQLEVLNVDSYSAVVRAPICSQLAPTLHTLMFSHANGITIFTREQEQALHLLSSLRHLEFESCHSLKYLPQGLHRFLSLKKLKISSCLNIESLPSKEGLPTSLETLEVFSCSRKATNQANKLKAAYPWFSVKVEGLDAVTTAMVDGIRWIADRW